MIRALIAEDDQGVRDVLGRTCRDLGLEVLEVDDGVACLEMVAAHAPDLLLLDLEMPGLDGMGVLAKLRAEMASPPEVMIVSGHPDALGRVDEKRLGVLDFIIKPFRLSVLRRRLERAVRLIELAQNVSDDEQSLVAMRQSDPITGLGAFFALRESLARRYVACARQGMPLSCGILSDERYDGLLSDAGRDPGNQRLISIARCLALSLGVAGDGTNDLYRVDAAEFVVLLSGADEVGARRALEGMVCAVRGELGDAAASMVCGFATVPHPELVNAESLFRAANVALARAREQRRLVLFEAF